MFYQHCHLTLVKHMHKYWFLTRDFSFALRYRDTDLFYPYQSFQSRCFRKQFVFLFLLFFFPFAHLCLKFHI